MLKSMTGFGYAKERYEIGDFCVEARSVNHRYLDLSVRLPRFLSFAEDAVKTEFTKVVTRGKVEVYVTADMNENATVKYDKNLARAYYDAFREMSWQLLGERSAPSPEFIARMPEVFGLKKADADADASLLAVTALAAKAAAELDDTRSREGARLCEVISLQLEGVEMLLGAIEGRAAQVVPVYRERLLARLRETLGSLPIEESRIVTEAALFADKTAVDEEITRLRSHSEELTRLITGAGAQGRKVDFLIQELNREANTIGSKANDADLAKLVVNLKSELEKIREQAQNLE